MSPLDQQLRAKRFKVKDNFDVKLIIDYVNGDKITFQVTDCSLNGVRTQTSYKFSDEDKTKIGTIIPAAKLVWDKFEFSLGRLAIRRLEEKGSLTDVAFSTIDIKVPVNSALSKALDIHFELIENHFELSPDRFNLAHFVENEYANVDLFDRLRKFDVFRVEWERSQKFGYKNVRVKSKGNRIELTRPRKNGRSDYLVMGSNDYLGLGAHPQVVEAAKKALDIYGFGSTGSAISTGTTDLHLELSAKLAKIHKKEAALLYNSGYAANVGVISALAAPNDLVIADMLCHASIQDGMQMCKGTSRFFKHNDATHLESILKAERENYNGCLVITEGVFSMDGDVAKLDEIFAVARKYNCRIMVDQAHCFGVVGPNGLGVCDKYNLLREVDIIMGTFSKICGAIGGFIAGSTELIEWLRYFSRAHLFTVSLPPSTVAAVMTSLDIFLDDPSHVQKLKTNIQHFVSSLNYLGFHNVDKNHESAVIPVIVGDEKKLGIMHQSLLDDGVFVVPVVYPAVSRSNCRFRFTIMSTHSISDLDYVITCIEKAMLKADLKVKMPTAKSA